MSTDMQVHYFKEDSITEAVMDWVDHTAVMDELKKVCKEIGIQLIKIRKNHRIAISYLGCIHAVVVYENATDIHIKNMMKVIFQIL